MEKANIKVKQQNKWFFDRESKQLRIADRPNEESPIRLIEANEKAPTGWKYKARNALMYFPQGKSESWVNQNEGRGAPKTIEHHNTHIIAAEPGEKRLTVPAGEGSKTPWSQLNGLQSESSATGDSPIIRGYKLVASTPQLSPTRLGTPEMTWGSIEGTPLLIAGSETPGRQYSMPNVSKREELGMKLSEKASRAYRKKTSERQRSTLGTPRIG